jgi:hypothetical protein
MATPETGGPGAGRVTVDPEFVDLLDSALRSARAGAIPRYVLTALRDAAAGALSMEAGAEARRDPQPAARHAREEIAGSRPATAALKPLQDWEPNARQVWRSGMRGSDGKRFTAWQAYQAGFGDLPRSALPYAHQVRQHPKTKELYNALCVYVSRNKAQRKTPASIADLFNVTDEARGGLLSASGGGRPRLKPDAAKERSEKRKRP